MNEPSFVSRSPLLIPESVSKVIVGAFGAWVSKTKSSVLEPDTLPAASVSRTVIELSPSTTSVGVVDQLPSAA
ncbi:hypothetical protein GNP59_12240 [Aliivibrio fischeri]|nr:hypothetical protein [Aliivibrio fischeri]